MARAIPAAICFGATVVLAACATPEADDRQPATFTLESWALQHAIGCLGEQEVRLPDGGVMHELAACAGRYSDARCTTLRAVSDELLVVGCAYTVTVGRRVQRERRYLTCDAPSADMRRCGADDALWTDAGVRAPQL